VSESLKNKSAKGRLIAVCGKGGVGKTAVTALITKVIVSSGRDLKLLAIDADPAMGLPNTLGVSVPTTMGEIRDNIIKTARTTREQRKTELATMLDYMVFETLIELDGYSLLAMGRSEAGGCYCPVNDLLRGAIEELSRGFDIVIIDGEAGLEQIHRNVMRKIDTLIAVTDKSARGFQVVGTIKKMAMSGKVLRCNRIGAVINRIREEEKTQVLKSARETGIEVFGCIPEDENIARHDLIGKPLLDVDSDSPAVIGVRAIVENLELLPQLGETGLK